MTGAMDDALIGGLVADRYRILELIGRGGMASVYRADDATLPREVAIKLMLPGTRDADEISRQRNEIETLASLNHHALVTLFDAGTEPTPQGDRAFLVMELVNGPNLRDALREGLDATQIAQIGADIAEALHYVHGKGIVHRDVKPANILLASDGLPGRPLHAKLADFGIARIVDSSRLTTTGVIIGTATYLSPEQALGNDVGPAADVYALGIVLIEALTGQNPFPGSAVESASARMVREPDIPDSLGASWGSLLADMTRLDPAKRMSAADVAVAARRIAGAGEHAAAADGTGGEETVAEPVPPVTPPASTMPETAAMTMPYAEETTDAEDDADVTLDTIEESAHTAPTERLARSRRGAATTTPAAPGTPHPEPRGPRAHRTRRGLIVAASAVLIAAAATVGAIAWGGASNPQPSAPPASPYPSVPGTLGTHLKQLQDSVRP